MVQYEFKVEGNMKFLWSGLEDINGDKIYDQDILIDEFGYKYKVVFEEGSFYVYSMHITVSKLLCNACDFMAKYIED